MALKKSTELPSGVTGEYWKVGAVRIHNGSAQVDMDLYKDQAARAAGKSTVQSKLVSFTGFDLTTLDEENMNPVKLAYTKAKELDEFSTAEDV